MTTEGTPEPQGEGTGTPQGEPLAPPRSASSDRSKDEGKPQGDPPKPQGDDSSGTDWKAEARKWEKAAKKDAAEKAKAEAQLQAINDLAAGKDKERTEAEKRASAAELEATKYRIAYEAGLPPDLAVRLTGSTEEELAADAEALAKYAKGARKPKSDAQAQGEGGGTKKDANTMFRQWLTASES